MALLEACAHLAPTLGKASTKVLTIPESSIKGTGRPDVAVQLDGLLTGYVELKAPDKPADPTKLKDQHDKDQWKKFQLLPNLIYTNGSEWSKEQSHVTTISVEAWGATAQQKAL